MSVWIWWAILAGGSFAVLETIAIATDRATLSNRLRSWLGIHPPKPWRHVGVLGLVGFLAWLGLHLILGI